MSAGPQCSPFWGFPYIYAYIHCRRTTKFDVCNTYGEGACFGGQPRSSPKGAVPQRSPTFGSFGFSSIYDYTLYRTTELGVVTLHIWGRDLFLGGHPRPPPQGGVALADPNFESSPPLMRTRLDLEPPNLAW